MKSILKLSKSKKDNKNKIIKNVRFKIYKHHNLVDTELYIRLQRDNDITKYFKTIKKLNNIGRSYSIHSFEHYNLLKQNGIYS